MPVIKIKKEKRETQIKCLGITLYSKKIDKEENFITFKLLANLLQIRYDIYKKTFKSKIANITLFKTKLRNSFRIWYFLFLPIWIENIERKSLNDFLNFVINKFPQYDDYYVFPCRSGEFFLLMHHLKDWLTNNNSKNFILIFTARYHLNICKMFFPDIPMAHIKKINVPLISRGVKQVRFTYKNKNILFPMYERYFVSVENNIRNKNAHYYELLKQNLGLSNKVEHYSISQKTQNKIKNIVKYLLNNNFVLISPETLSNEPMEKDFWDNLTAQLKKMGYEVFCNSMEFKNLTTGSTSTFLSYEEAIELAKYAKAIIGMRSGFLECLSQNNVPLFALYTDFPERSGFKRLSSDKVLSGFSITKLPNTNPNNIFEYDVNTFDNENDIISNILEKIESEES